MNEALRDKLIETAKARDTVTYGEVAPLAGLDLSRPDDRELVAGLLREICLHEHQQGRPLLAAIVVHKDDGNPGRGFYKLAELLDRYAGGDAKSDRAFLEEEQERVWDYWTRAR